MTSATVPIHSTAGSASALRLLQRLRVMTFTRVLIVGALLGATALVEPAYPSAHDQGSRATDFFLLVIGSGVLGLSILYALALQVLRSERGLRYVAYIQLAGDAVFAGALVLVTGGTTSSFTFFFSVTILLAAVVLFRPGAIFQATCASLLFITIGVLEVSGASPTAADGGATPADKVQMPSAFDESEQAGLIGGLIYKVINNVLAFYAVAFLASHLAESLRERDVQLEETSESLENLRALHDNIIASIPSGLFTTDSQDRVTYFNPRAVDITGVPAPAAQDEFAADLFPVLAVHLALGADSDEPFLVASTLAQPDGTRRFLQWQLSELRDTHDARVGHLVTVQDVTDVREMAEQVQVAQQFATIGRLAASIAHEIRNPLTSISGCIQLLRQTLEVEGANERLMTIVSNETDALNAWITDFLTYARPRLSDLVPVDLRALVDDVVTAAEYDTRRPDVTLKVVGPEEAFVMADALYVRQAIWNVLVNAVQASPEGGVVRCNLSAIPSHGVLDGFVRLAIADQGDGIDPDVEPRIFDPFVTTKDHGTGLGLATAYRVVSEHSGRLTFETRLGVGTTFFVDLPPAPAAEFS